MFKGKYDTTTSHKIMLQDSFRTFSYIDAIDSAVCNGDTAIDFGSGSGVLALAAARAGCKKVYAIERNPSTAKWLSSNIQKNGLDNIIEIFVGNASEFIKKFKTISVDIVISECIGDHLFENTMIIEYLSLVDAFKVQKKIPERFLLSLYPSCISEKQQYLKKSLAKLQEKNIEFSLSSYLLEDEILDVSYFSGFNDKDDPYFLLENAHAITEKDVLFDFDSMQSLKNYYSNNGEIKTAVYLPEGNGYVMLYFYVELFDNIHFHNHPSRPAEYKHSYFQRLIKKQGEQGKIVIDLHHDKLYNEDTPCKNIRIDYD